MNPVLENWKAQLIGLSRREPVELAHFLLDTLGPEDEGVEAAWDAEASRRVHEIRAGVARGRDADGPLTELRERYP
jgi:hypothetical protein